MRHKVLTLLLLRVFFIRLLCCATDLFPAFLQPRHHAEIMGCRHWARDEEHGRTYGNYNIGVSFTKKGHVVMWWVSRFHGSAVWPPICLSVCHSLTHSVCLPACLSLSLFFGLTVCLSARLFSICLLNYLFVTEKTNLYKVKITVKVNHLTCISPFLSSILDVPSSFRTDQYSVLTGSKDCSMKIWSLASGELSVYEGFFSLRTFFSEDFCYKIALRSKSV